MQTDDGAAVYVSLVSLLDASAQFQLTVCHDYCARHDLAVLTEIQEYGRLTLAHLESPTWLRLLDTGAAHVVFYQLAQFGTSVAQFYAQMQPSLLKLHFVKDCVIFDGERTEPVFRIVPMDVSTSVRRQLRDFIALMHMGSCTAAVLREFVAHNFGSFECLIKTLKANLLLVSMELQRHREPAKHASADTRARRKALSVSRFSAFLSRVKHLRALCEPAAPASAPALDAVCTAMRCVSL
ncbi:serine recombinase [Equine molluscum contagiosum-like virus]|nr:serine recombinase [Equine molluscum contagiosum-like virus]